MELPKVWCVQCDAPVATYSIAVSSRLNGGCRITAHCHSRVYQVLLATAEVVEETETIKVFPEVD